MGLEITSTSRSQSKPQYTVATTAAASVAVADGELVVFVGSTVQTNVEAFNGIGVCVAALRENDWPNPTTLQFASAMFDTKTKVLTVQPDGVLPTLTEDVVAVIRGLDYTGPAESCSKYVSRMAELYLENSKAA
jgi:hypothetical protein